MGKHQITERDIKKHEEKDVIDPAGFHDAYNGRMRKQ